jgi:hypothetical protein
MVGWSKAGLRFTYTSIDALWAESRRVGVLTQLYRERVGDWRLLKCVRAYAKYVVEVKNARLMRLLGQIFAWVRVRMNEGYLRARSMLRSLAQAGKYRIGIWGSAGLQGRLLRFYLSAKNGSAPRALMVDLYGRTCYEGLEQTSVWSAEPAGRA